MLISHPGPRARRPALGAAAALCCAFLHPGAAGQTGQPSDTVVVTASRTPQRLTRVLADVSVLEREAIERSGASCAVDLLAGLPGLAISRAGGPAGITSVFVRGAETRHTAVFIDGLRVDDQGTGGARWELLPIDEIERIEVLRGPAAAIYGSDAVAGVVQLFTRRGGGTRVSAGLTVGSQATVIARAAASGQVGALDYALSASHGRSSGFNALETATSNPDRDGWRRSGLQARLGTELAPGHRLEAALLASHLWGQYDQSRGADDVSRQTLRTANLRWQGQWSAEADTQLSVGESRTTYESQPSYYRSETTLRNLVLQQGWRAGAHLFSAVLEHKDDRLHNPATAFAGTFGASRTQDGIGLGWQADFGQHQWQANLRHDHDSTFGGQPTGSLAWGWQWAPAWRVTAAAATAFRAPTLYQRFSEYGVATLVPETSRNLEFGLRWAEGGHQLSATVWHNRLRDLINFGAAGPCANSFGCYENVGRARYEGVTLAGTGHWPAAHGGWPGLKLQGSLDWQDPRNLDTDKRLQRRSRLAAKLQADTAWAGWGLGLDWQGVGQRWDNAGNTRSLGGYGVVNLRASRALAPGWTLEGRIDNLADKDYQLARNYPTGGRTAQLGVRWQMP